MLLHKHISTILKRRGVDVTKIIRERGRLFIQTPEAEGSADAAARVFGVVSASPVWSVAAKLKEINTIAAMSNTANCF